jgi:predicted nucleic acid-binding protein
MDELARVLQYPRIVKRLEKRQAKELLDNLGTLAEWVDGQLTLDVLTVDPSDNKYLACAIEAHCSFLVTGNSAHFQETGTKYKGVEIINPRGFLDVLSLERPDRGGQTVAEGRLAELKEPEAQLRLFLFLKTLLRMIINSH